MVSFSRVKEILDNAVLAWEAKTGAIAILRKHDVQFGWSTREQLLSAKAFGRRLIDEAHIQNQTGAESNLVQILSVGLGAFPRMPIRGPYISDAEIAEIVEWIDSGAAP